MGVCVQRPWQPEGFQKCKPRGDGQRVLEDGLSRFVMCVLFALARVLVGQLGQRLREDLHTCDGGMGEGGNGVEWAFASRSRAGEAQ